MRVFSLLLLLSIFDAEAQVSGGVDLYVSPTGDDGNPGSLERPLRTLERARDAVRAAKAGPGRNIVVYLRSGVYTIDRTFTLSAEDSGWPNAPIVYRNFKGEAAVISGGVRLKGWTSTGSGIWKARTTQQDFRQLYVDGRRAIRSRGAVPAGSRFEGSSAIFIQDGRLAEWKNPQDVELVFDVQWERNILKVLKIEPSGSGALLSMIEPYFTLARMKEGKQIELPTHIENALELLDEPGEWYLDRSAHEVYYKPRPGENMESAEVIAPALEQLVAVRGTFDQPIHDIRFEGITFAHGTWLQPSRIGHVDVQANFTMPQTNLLLRSAPGFSAFGPGPAQLSAVLTDAVRSPANVVLDAAKSIRFERCVFRHLGGAGLDIGNGSQDNLVSGSKFEDIAGTAIQIGDVTDHHPKDLRAVVRNNRVSNCYIADAANQYIAGVGIFAGYTDGTTIAHNEIMNLPYSGISIGWGWGETDVGGGGYYQPVVFETPTVSRNNRVEYNHIHHVMQLLWDGAGIYTLGDMPGTVVRGNHVHDNPGVPGGIYLDEGSARIEVAGNLVYDVKPWGKRDAQPINFNNRRQNRIATCHVHDNHFFANKPEDSGPLRDIAETAGLEQTYRDIK
ncbi:MAG: hypothetical protein DMG57_02235 [Acidobacteria bacterium]|nr:MAG: hypothetical protein DMG57_02235 [Acidobacteriota bacterium]